MKLKVSNKDDKITKVMQLLVDYNLKRFREICGVELEELYYFGSEEQLKEKTNYFVETIKRELVEK